VGVLKTAYMCVHALLQKYDTSKHGYIYIHENTTFFSIKRIQNQNQSPYSSLREKMSVEVLDAATIVNFVEDEEAFNVSIRDRFARLDTDRDGLLSYAEMLKELQSLRVFETHFGIDVKPDPDELAHVYDSLFIQFDHDSNGAVDLEEFKEETKQMMLAMANDIGFLPVQMALEEDSFLKKAVECESMREAV
jgi:Ca2+-binding EF-hand superfamily protein